MLPELMLIPTYFILSFSSRFVLLFVFVFSMRVGKEEEEGFGEMSDPSIKLFGREIAVPEDELEGDFVADRDEGTDDVKETNDLKTDNSKKAGDCKVIMPSNPNNGNGDGEPEPGLAAKECSDTNPKQDQVETDASGKDHKVLKKPDKIVPCPRCNSLDTKFCYYNNYNINQPRHFCKNCQRYWTAGGTMRNVPVGAGRRKNKHSASHYRQLAMTSEEIPLPRVDICDPAHGQVASVHHVPSRPLKASGPVLKPIEAMVNILHLGGEQNREGEIHPVALGENEGEPSCSSSSMKVSECMENDQSQKVTIPVEQNGVSVSSNRLPTMHPMPCYPAPPWAYPWNLAWNNVTQDGANPNSIPWHPPAVIAAPAVCTPAIPFPFIPPPFWGCMPGWPGGAWAVPMVGPNVLSPTSSTSNNSGCSGSNSPTLGKHSRDTSMQVEEKPEKSLWVPKTLRIDDPDEAAKSSIWATLGIKPDRNGPASKGSIFKAFQSKAESKDHPSDTTPAFHANPAALSRSQNFQEAT